MGTTSGCGAILTGLASLESNNTFPPTRLPWPLTTRRSQDPPTIGVKHLTSPFSRSKRPAAKAPSCGWGKIHGSRSTRFPPAHSISTPLSESEVSHAAASRRSTGRNPAAKRRWPCTWPRNAQRLGGVAAFIDAEHALDVEYAKKLGVDVENLLVSQPDTGEEALEIAEILVRSSAVEVIVVDSVAALVPKAEIEGDRGDSHMGLQARLMSQALRKLAGSINRSRTSVIFINQLRQKIGVMFGNPETTTGGRALKFYSSVRLDVRRIGAVKERDEITGSRVRVKVVKNKVAPPFRQAEFDIMFNEGISHIALLVDMAVEAGIIEKSGAWYSYGKERVGQGRENAKLYLKDHPETTAEIETRIKEYLGIPSLPVQEQV